MWKSDQLSISSVRPVCYLLAVYDSQWNDEIQIFITFNTIKLLILYNIETLMAKFQF